MQIMTVFCFFLYNSHAFFLALCPGQNTLNNVELQWLSGHSCLVPDLQGKVFNILSFSMFAVSLLEIKDVPFFSDFAKSFYH